MEFLISALATYGISIALTEAPGPADLLIKLRNKKQAKLLTCYICTAIVIGAFIALYSADNPVQWFIYTLALGGAAIAIDRFSV